MSDYLIKRLEAVDALLNWKLGEVFLKEGLAQDEHTLLTIGDLRCEVQSTSMCLWHVFEGPNIRGAFVTQVVRGSAGQAINVIVMGGDKMPEWIVKFSDEMNDYGRLVGARYICEMGREGWARVLKPLGWLDANRVMLKKVS